MAHPRAASWRFNGPCDRSATKRPATGGAHRGRRRALQIAAAATVAALVGGGSWLIGHQAGLNEPTGQVTALPTGTHVDASSRSAALGSMQSSPPRPDGFG